MIPIWYEESGVTKEFGSVVERCVFCPKPTRTWHENTNNPVCVNCANYLAVRLNVIILKLPGIVFSYLVHRGRS